MRVLDPAAAVEFRHADTYLPREQRPDYITAADIEQAAGEAVHTKHWRGIPETGGIYMLVNMRTGWVYAGRSTNMRARVRVHWTLLKHGKHSCLRLQADFDAHGPDAFGAVVLTHCKGHWGFLCELAVLRLLESRPSYNVQRIDFLGRANMSEERKAKVSADLLSAAAVRRQQWMAA